MEDAQQQHDKRRVGRKVKLSPDSGKKLEALLAGKKEPSSARLPSTAHDPIETMLRNHPQLTREKAEQMVEDYGF